MNIKWILEISKYGIKFFNFIYIVDLKPEWTDMSLFKGTILGLRTWLQITVPCSLNKWLYAVSGELRAVKT